MQCSKLPIAQVRPKAWAQELPGAAAVPEGLRGQNRVSGGGWPSRASPALCTEGSSPLPGKGSGFILISKLKEDTKAGGRLGVFQQDQDTAQWLSKASRQDRSLASQFIHLTLLPQDHPGHISAQ